MPDPGRDNSRLSAYRGLYVPTLYVHHLRLALARRAWRRTASGSTRRRALGLAPVGYGNGASRQRKARSSGRTLGVIVGCSSQSGEYLCPLRLILALCDPPIGPQCGQLSQSLARWHGGCGLDCLRCRRRCGDNGRMLGHADSRMAERVYAKLPPDLLRDLLGEFCQPAAGHGLPKAGSGGQPWHSVAARRPLEEVPRGGIEPPFKPPELRRQGAHLFVHGPSAHNRGGPPEYWPMRSRRPR